ncbi:MAG: TIGR04211 family SH3 domain-containing protein [Gammaproteobacteria bacterium TMED1]|nr:MAG: TIGR04211 family SH3 domain-containing protein [Gammaproteobacteria bacterium TMED1]
MNKYQQVLAICLLAIAIGTVNAEVVYVRDVIYVPLREGQSSEDRVLHNGLRSGTRLERLTKNTETGNSLVRTKNGMEGWIPNQYLIRQPIAADLLNEAKQRLKVINQEYELALLRIEELEDILTQKNLREKALNARNLEISGELETNTQLSAKATEIDEGNSQLLIEQESQIANLGASNSAFRVLQDESKQLWFLYGASSVALSMLIGFWVARRIYRDSKSGGWS